MNTTKNVLIQVFSDIQIYNRIPNIPAKTDYLFLAGNICDIEHPLFFRFLDDCSHKWKKTFYVPGNREYYSKTKTVNELDFQYNKQIYQRYNNVYFLNNRFAPLGSHDSPFKNINVYGSISWYIPHYPVSNYPTTVLDAVHINKLAENSMNRMITYLNETAKKTLVVTHYPPVRSKEHLFFSDKQNRLERINTSNVPLWITAHPHWNSDFNYKTQSHIVNRYVPMCATAQPQMKLGFHDKNTRLIVNPYDEDTINAVFEIEISDSECNTLVNSNNIE
jgi:predicted phosphohydrolase